MTTIAEQIKTKMQEYGEVFRSELLWFHQHPELSFKEHNTTDFIKNKLKELDIEILDTDLETGCIALLNGRYEGPCIALRSDIDALPIHEQSSSEKPSTQDGIMHACGHDTHMSSVLGAARILSDLRDQIRGSVKFLFQPAEEINLGAKKMMSLGCLENPKVDAIFGLHNSPEVPVGSVAVKNGPLMAAVDRIIIKIRGKGGHGGIPQRNIDPIVATASIIQSVQTIVSRNISPLDSCVVSICNISSGVGTVNNVIPDEVTMYGTVRTFKKEIANQIESRLREMIQNISVAYGCQGKLEYIYELAVTDNNPALYDCAFQAVRRIGATPVDPIPSTGGEDFSEYLSGDAPGFFYWLGVRNETKDCVYSWHSPHFKADEDSVIIGAGTMAMSVFTAIEQLSK